MLPDDRADRLDRLLDARDLAAVWFARPASFAWLTGGRNVVDRSGDAGAAAAGYRRDGGPVVVTSDVEAPRLRDEEVDVPVESFPWHEFTVAEAVAERSTRPAAADFDAPGLADVDATELRQPLAPVDVERYRDLGAEVAATVESVCRGAGPDDAERSVAARLRGALAERGVDSPVALVGGAGRATEYRHYTPTGARLGAYALVSVTAERGGRFASCTRTVAFDPPAWLEDRHRAAARVEVTALAATRTAETAGEVFDDVRAAYDAVGWPDEWRAHHQGGAAGFAGREWIATPGSEARVTRPMAYAWNPTVRGAKSEDTHLVTDDGVETLTAGEWPTDTVEAVGYDLELPRPLPLVP